MHRHNQTHILIVEDNPGDVRITQLMLGDDPLCKYTFTACDTLHAAAQFLADSEADIVLLDLNLPDSSGLATYASLQEKAPHLPVVIMSGNDNLDVASQAVRSGAQDYIVKGSVDSAALARIIRYAIERKQVIAKLKESEMQYRQIVETAREGMWIIKSDDTVAFVNQELANILGYKKEEIVGSNSLNYVLKEDRDELKQKIRNRRNGIKETYEFRVLRSDGKPLSVLISSTPNFDDQGNYIGALAMITDITHRKDAELAIALERDRAQKYFDVAGVILLVLDAEGKVESINKKGTHILGYENPDELIGLDWFANFIPADLGGELRSAHRKIITSAEDTNNYAESRIVTRSGTQRHIAWHHTSIRDPHGTGNIATLSSGEDITERVVIEKQRELLLQLSRQASSEADFEKLLFFITKQLVEIIDPVDSASIFLIDYQQEVAVLKAWAGFGEENLKAFEVPLQGSITNRVITTRKPQHVRDIKADPGFIEMEDGRNADIRSSIAAPIIGMDGQAAGIIFCDSRARTNAFNDNDLALLDSICRQLAGLIENVRLLDQISTQHTALQQRDLQYHDLFNSIFNGFALHEMIFDDQGSAVDYRFLEVNPAFCDMTGLQEKDLIGKSVLEIFPATEPYWIEAYAKVVNTGKPLRVQNYSVEFDKFFEVIAFSPAKGQFATVVSDITEQRMLISALKQERDRAQDYLDIAEVMIVALDENGVITLANRKSCEMLGYQENELIGSNWFELCVPPYDRERRWELYLDYLANDVITGPNFEQAFLTKKGEERIALWQSRKLFDEHGKAIGTLSSGEDITEQQRIQQALIESENQLGNIINNSTNLFYSHTPEQLFTFISPQSESILGYKPEEMMMKWVDLLTDNPANTQGILRTEKAIATGEVQPPYDQEMRAKSGRHVWVEVHEAPLQENGKVTAIVGSMTDITSRRRAELESRQSLASLKIANEDLRAVHARLQGTIDATIRTIAKTVEVRDPYTAGHHRRVSELSVRIAREMELEDEMVKAIEMAAVIHDLGKIQVPAEILSKPGRLSEIEFGLVKIHPAVGYDLLKDIDFPWPLAEIVHQHHERMDGSGYPRGIKGDEISLESRIIGVADTVEAMASHRPYRPALGIDRALQQIKQDRGTFYDPQVVDACLRVFESGYHMPSD